VLNTLAINAAQLASEISNTNMPLTHMVQALWGAVGANKLRDGRVHRTIGEGGQGCILEIKAADGTRFARKVSVNCASACWNI
jgi:hypothetical protein